MFAITHGHYPNRLELEVVPGVITWVVLATDATVYASIALLKAAGKLPWPQSFTLATVITPGIDPGMNMLGALVGQSDASGAAGSAFYIEINQATAPTSDNPGALVLSGGSANYSDVGALNNVWVRMTSATDKLRLTLRY
jgi:hypothetical protein